MRKILTAAAAATALAAVSPAMAIDQAEKWELQLLGAGSSDSEFEAGGFTMNAQVGYYFTDQFQVRLGQSATYADTGDDNTWSATTRLGGYYHFNYSVEQQWVPYIGANLGYVYGDGVSDTFVAGPEVGVRYFVNDTTFITGSIAYDFFFDDAGDADSAFDDGQFVYAIGIGFQW
jgi:hypothetical protein